METSQCIRSRRSIRRYRPDPVPREILEEIVEEALWAPSGTNRQAWHVVVATGDARDDLCTIISGTVEGLKARLEDNLPGKVVKATLKFFANLGDAPCLALVFVPHTAAHHDPGMTAQEQHLGEAERLDRIESASALMQNLCLAAWDRGLGTCWMLAPRYAASEIYQYLGLTDLELVAATPIGWPAHVSPGPARRPGRVSWVGWD